MYSDIILCATSHSKFWHIQNSPYTGIFRHIQANSALLRNIHTYKCIIKVHLDLFSVIFRALCNPRIFATLPIPSLAYLEPEAHSKPCETLTRHVQNPATVRTVYSSIIQLYSGIFITFCNRLIWRNLAYLESWNIQNSSIIAYQYIFRTLSYLKQDTNSDPSPRIKMACSKLQYLTGLWICPYLNKYSITWRVTSHYVLYENNQNPGMLKTLS